MQLDPSWRPFAWRVPDHIVEAIPARIRALLGCIDKPLIVIRNLNLVDICAGKATFMSSSRIACAGRKWE